MNLIIKLMYLAILCLVLASFLPGLLSSIVLPLIFIFLLLTPILLVIAIIVRFLVVKGKIQVNFKPNDFLLPSIVFFASLILIALDLPSKSLFLLFKDNFDQVVLEKRDIKSEFIGPFLIERAYYDENSAYFITWTHGDGLGPDIVSHGFYKGNVASRTPVGGARLNKSEITDGWFKFSVSDDF